MHQRATREGQQRLDQPALGRRVAVKAVLVHGIADALREVGFQLGGSDRKAIDEKHQVERILGVVQRMMHLAHDAQPIGRVCCWMVGLMASAGLNCTSASGFLRPTISTPRRSTSSVPCSFRHLRTRSASTLGRLAPWILLSCCQLSGWVASIQASRSGRYSAFCRS